MCRNGRKVVSSYYIANIEIGYVALSQNYISEGNCGLEFQGSSTLKLNFKGQSRSRVPKTFQGFFKGTLENPRNFKGVSRVPLKTLQFQGKVEGENFKGGENRGKG